MIKEFKKEVAAKIVNFCTRKAEEYGIPDDMMDYTILGCSISVIEELKKESARLVGVMKHD